MGKHRTRKSSGKRKVGAMQQRLHDREMNKHTNPMIVARRGEVVHFEANGLRDVERNLPMEKDSIFRIYSQSKPITGAALMMLFEEGKFLMTDSISKYLQFVLSKTSLAHKTRQHS